MVVYKRGNTTIYKGRYKTVTVKRTGGRSSYGGRRTSYGRSRRASGYRRY